MSLTFENSLGIPPGPRKGNGHGDSLCEARGQPQGQLDPAEAQHAGRRGGGLASCTRWRATKRGGELGSGHGKAMTARGSKR